MVAESEKPDRTKVRVLIVDDHPVVREGLAMQVSAQDDLEVCGEADDVLGAMAMIASTEPDVAIIDVSLKDSNGFDLIKRIRDRNADMRILVWSMFPENLYAERALRAGAQGYLNKSRATHELLDAIRAIVAGKIYVSGQTASDLLQRIIGGKDDNRSPIEKLSDRELEAFDLMGHGLTTEVIAARMHVSPKTVETYRARIKEKLGIGNVNELVQRATQWVLEKS